MLNFKKTPTLGVSLISLASHAMATIISQLYEAGRLEDRPMVPIDIFRIGKLPGWAMTPTHKHGCNKRGGRSKRRRGLNYWRH